MRRKGIATKLLEQVCKDAVEEGYDLVEAMPGNSRTDIHRNYHGPSSLYEKSGFSLHKELKDMSIVRKYLK
jgi:GNAT superfamily N-acetyltransferase